MKVYAARKELYSMGLLQHEPLAVKEEQYNEKNLILEQFGEQVDKWTFYEDVFGDTVRSFLPINLLLFAILVHGAYLIVRMATTSRKGY